MSYKPTKKEIADAYCENESTHGYYCTRPDCPWCPPAREAEQRAKDAAEYHRRMHVLSGAHMGTVPQPRKEGHGQK